MNAFNEARRRVSFGRATVSWGPCTYGKPRVVASAPVAAIDDLVAAVLQAQAEIKAAQ